MTMSVKTKRLNQLQLEPIERDKQICFVLMRLYQALHNTGDGAASAEIAELESKLKKLQA